MSKFELKKKNDITIANDLLTAVSANSWFIETFLLSNIIINIILNQN